MGITQPILGEIAKGRDIGLRPQVRYVWAVCPDCQAGRWISYRRSRGCAGRCYSCARKDQHMKNPYENGPESTRAKAVAIRRSGPSLSGPAIAIQLGVSKSRIGKIFQEENLPSLPRQKPVLQCKGCGASFVRTKHRQGIAYCSKACWPKARYVTVTCAQCGGGEKR
jgi:hypothetical protein